MTWWSGYQRRVRHDERCWVIFVPRVRCGACTVTHVLLPAFVLVGRLDVVETIGAVIAEVGGRCGVRPSAARLGVPYTTARGWWRRFGERAERLAVAFGALAVELGGAVADPLVDRGRWALSAMSAAWEAALRLPGWAMVGSWRFVCSVSGGRMIATNTNPLSIIVGKRRFIPPVP